MTKRKLDIVTCLVALGALVLLGGINAVLVRFGVLEGAYWSGHMAGVLASIMIVGAVSLFAARHL